VRALNSPIAPISGTITAEATAGMATGVCEITTSTSMPAGSGAVAGSGSWSSSALEDSNPGGR
jgi:hypothetical protein